jgi:hypothetical protein
VPLRAAAICGLLAPVTFVAGLLFGDLAQPDAFSPANDNISDIGAQTADQAWIYNQIAANLNGLLILAFALGLWRALGSGWLARLGVLGLAVLGVTRFLEGFLRLDCRGMDEGCENTSWQADAHGIESGTAVRAAGITWFLWLGAPSVAADAPRGRENGQTGWGGGGLAAL